MNDWQYWVTVISFIVIFCVAVYDEANPIQKEYTNE
jgi:hypothetical protein